MKKFECWEKIFGIVGLFLVLPLFLNTILIQFIPHIYCSIISNVISFIIIILFLHFKYKDSDIFYNKIVGLKNINSGQLIILFIILLICIFLNKENPNENISYIITGIFISPFVEELIFRGYIQYLLSKVYNIQITIFFTSLLFVLLHFNYLNNIYIMSSVFIFSLFLGYLKYKYKNIIYPSIIHMINNYTALI